MRFFGVLKKIYDIIVLNKKLPNKMKKARKTT